MMDLSRLGLFRDQSGVVLLEFLIAFVPLWTLFVCAVQLAFIAQASLIVKHAADSAARAAIVVLPDDPNEYGGEPQMSVARNSTASPELAVALGRTGSSMQNPGAAGSIVGALSDRTLVSLGRSRLNTMPRLSMRHTVPAPFRPRRAVTSRTPEAGARPAKFSYKLYARADMDNDFPIVRLGEMYLVLHFLGVPVSLGQTLLILAGAKFAFLLPFPGALGALELTYVGLFEMLELGAETGLSLVLYMRARDLLFAVAVTASSSELLAMRAPKSRGVSIALMASSCSFMDVRWRA